MPSNTGPVPPAYSTPGMAVCSVCHQPLLPQYYFCPNCGTKVHDTPLSTSVGAQTKLYLFSIILPMMGFLFVNRWKGIQYYKSKDLKAQRVGQAAWALILISTIIVVWLAIVWTQDYIKETVNGINSDMSTTGY